MNDSGSSTHRPRAIDPTQFRQQATGIGQTRAASQATGAMRAACVAAHMPARQARAVPAAEGFVKPVDPTTGMPPVEDFGDSEF